MKAFTTQDVDHSGPHAKLYADKADMVYNPPEWMKRGLMQTATGYGRKLNTGYSISFNGKMRRVYCCCYSNAGTCYITSGGNWAGNKLIIG